HRALPHQPEAAQRARRRARGDAPAAGPRRRGRGRHALPAADPGPDDRGPREPHAVPVHARGAERRAARGMGCQAAGEARDGARARRRRERPADPGPAGLRGHRPRQRLAPRRHRGGGPQAINDLYVASTNGTQVPLSAVAKIVEKPTSLAVNHIGQFPAATISFNLAQGASLGAAVKAIEAAEKEIGMPVAVRTGFEGAALAFRASLSNTIWLLLAAVATMYIVLGVLYESYI